MLIVATPEPANLPPRIRLEVTASPTATVTIRRTDADGSNAPVRSANPATTVAGAWTGYDYEAPFNDAVTYTVTAGSLGTATAAVAALREYGAQWPWLIHPGIPDLSIRLDGPTIGDETRDTLQGVHQVLGREAPIVITDGVRHAPTFDLTIKARTVAADTAIEAILADASVLLLQLVFPFTDLSDYYWVAIGATVRTRLTDDYGEPYYRWALPCTAVSTPAGLLQAQRTWADVLASYATWADVLAGYASWNGLLIDDPAA